MYLAHSYGNAGAGHGARIYPDRRAARLAVDVSIVIVGILFWALMSRAEHSGAEPASGANVAAAEECVYFGRAGARCAEHVDSRERGKSTGDQYCRYFGRAGRRCDPEPSSR